MEFYQTGNIIYSGYWRNYDKVLGVEGTPGQGDWRVQVQQVDEQGNPIKGTEPRWHSTLPSKGDRIEKLATPAETVAATTPPGMPTIKVEKTEALPVQVVPTIIPMSQQARVVEPPPLVETPVEEPVFSITNEAFKEFDKPFSDFDLNTIPEEMIIKVQAIREETGKPLEIYENAREAIKDHREKMKQFKSLLDCIKA